MARHGKNDFHNGRDYGADRPAGGGLLGDGVGALVRALLVAVPVVLVVVLPAVLVSVLGHEGRVPRRVLSTPARLGSVEVVDPHPDRQPA